MHGDRSRQWSRALTAVPAISPIAIGIRKMAPPMVSQAMNPATPTRKHSQTTGFRETPRKGRFSATAGARVTSRTANTGELRAAGRYARLRVPTDVYILDVGAGSCIVE